MNLLLLNLSRKNIPLRGSTPSMNPLCILPSLPITITSRPMFRIKIGITFPPSFIHSFKIFCSNSSTLTCRMGRLFQSAHWLVQTIFEFQTRISKFQYKNIRQWSIRQKEQQSRQKLFAFLRPCLTPHFISDTLFWIISVGFRHDLAFRSYSSLKSSHHSSPYDN
jgi:hypothetical protein